MAVEGHAASDASGTVVRDGAALTVFYTSLALIIMGVGFLKPNISTIVGRLYAQDDPRRDSGFSLFYAGRSEEHTSELQSLMRISYAVFCLKKKQTHISQSIY